MISAFASRFSSSRRLRKPSATINSVLGLLMGWLIITRPNLLKGSFKCIMGPTKRTLVYVVKTNHSSTKIHAFLGFLLGRSFEQIMELVDKHNNVFALRKGLHSMARQYASDDAYQQREDMFAYQEWDRGSHSAPLEVFSTACRTRNVNTSLVKEAILDFHGHASTPP